MKSEITGAGTSDAEVLNVSPHGLWLVVKEREYFLDFQNFPWFRDATIGEICGVELLHENHLYWPELDIDLDLERITAPEKFPLVYQK
jgi:hypothetical protein